MTFFSFLFFTFIVIAGYFVFRSIFSESMVSLKAASRYYNSELLDKLDRKAEDKGLRSQAEILKKDFWKDL